MRAANRKPSPGAQPGIEGVAITMEPQDDTRATPATPRPFRSPVQFFAFGLGSGLSPKAPGTAGTLAAIPLYLLVADIGLPVYTTLLGLACLVGVYLCGAASRELGVHDHGGIVWDEFVGFWITMWAVPLTWQTVLAGFLLFRLFDIAKPWPISALDKRVGGGFGIMVDDVIAGMFSCLLLHLGWRALSGEWPLG